MEKKRSGFDAPVIGHVEPKGTKIKRNPDGTISYVYPKKEDSKAKKPAKKPAKK